MIASTAMRLAALVMITACVHTSSAPSPVTTTFQEESVKYPSGDVSLGAALLLPDAEGKRPAIVVIQGSGNSDRSNAWARSIAESLGARGIVTLLTDKRGNGQSGGDWTTVGFEELADDAIAGASFLASRPEVDRSRVGLIGLSQGGMILPLALTRGGEIVAFGIDVSGSAVPFTEQIDHEMRNTTLQAGLSEADADAVVSLNGLAGRFIIENEWEPYENALRAGLQGPWKPVAAGFPQTRDDPRWDWLGKVATFDPLPYWRRVTQPVLVVYGEKDEDDNVPVAKSVTNLADAFRDRRELLRVEVYPESGHAIYEPDRPELRRDFVELMTEWIYSR